MDFVDLMYQKNLSPLDVVKCFEQDTISYHEFKYLVQNILRSNLSQFYELIITDTQFNVKNKIPDSEKIYFLTGKTVVNFGLSVSDFKHILKSNQDKNIRLHFPNLFRHYNQTKTIDILNFISEEKLPIIFYIDTISNFKNLMYEPYTDNICLDTDSLISQVINDLEKHIPTRQGYINSSSQLFNTRDNQQTFETFRLIQSCLLNNQESITKLFYNPYFIEYNTIYKMTSTVEKDQRLQKKSFDNASDFKDYRNIMGYYAYYRMVDRFYISLLTIQEKEQLIKDISQCDMPNSHKQLLLNIIKGDYLYG